MSTDPCPVDLRSSIKTRKKALSSFSLHRRTGLSTHKCWLDRNLTITVADVFGGSGTATAGAVTPSQSPLLPWAPQLGAPQCFIESKWLRSDGDDMMPLPQPLLRLQLLLLLLLPDSAAAAATAHTLTSTTSNLATTATTAATAKITTTTTAVWMCI